MAHPERKNRRTLPTNEGGIPTIEQIKGDLQRRCGEISQTTWDRFFPDRQMPLGQYTSSPMLPDHLSHHFALRAGIVVELPIPKTVGYDEVHTVLTPQGRIMEILVDYKEDDGPEKNTPDIVLGETSEERYRNLYGEAMKKLDWLQRSAEKISRSA